VDDDTRKRDVFLSITVAVSLPNVVITFVHRWSVTKLLLRHKA
jgi:hypothetical protein